LTIAKLLRQQILNGLLKTGLHLEQIRRNWHLVWAHTDDRSHWLIWHPIMDIWPKLVQQMMKDFFSGSEGTYSRTEGFLTYYEICENIATKGWTEVWDDDIKAPYAYGTDDGLDQWIGYDNPASIEYKVRMAKDYDLGAIMWWSIDNDDFKGQFCGQGPYPLLNASKREWNRPGGNGGNGNPTQGPTSGPTSAHTTKPSTTKPTTRTTQPQNGCTNGILYPHADSCQKYYQCANSQLIENSCASGLFFNNNGGYCDWESNVDCCNGQRPCNN